MLVKATSVATFSTTGAQDHEEVVLQFEYFVSFFDFN